MMFDPGMVQKRQDFGSLCQNMGARLIVEIGTDHGLFARDLLESWLVEEGWLYTVDPYNLEYELAVGMTRDTPAVVDQFRLGDLVMAAVVLAPFADRCRMITATSLHAARSLTSWGVQADFVYIDGDHAGDAVAADVRAWWPLVRSGGILAGHDFVNSSCPGVQESVLAFGRELDLPVWTTKDFPPSWWIAKP